MRQEYPLYIVTLFVITLSTLNLYLLSNNIQQINNYQSEESSNNNNNNEWQQYLMDSEEQWNNNNNNNNKQIYKDIKRDKVELARMSRPTTSLPLSSNKLKQQEENISNTNIIKSPLLTNNNNNNNSNNSNNNSNNNNNNIPTFPPIYSTCDTFYQHYFNQSYNTEYLSDNLITHKYKVSICTRVKNEAKYVQEWLLYNWLILRVSHFYVYDDNSSDNLLQVLQPFIDRGIVTYIYWDNNRTVAEELVAKEPQFTRGQRFSIADCTTKYKIHSEWLAFWDIDEFVYLPEGHLDTYVKERRWDNILIPWAIFGSSNHTDIQPGLVINNYRWRIPLLQFGVTKAEGKYYGKVLYKTKCIPLAAVHLEDMTSSRCVLGDYPVRLDHDVEGYPIHMKHYWSKSYEDYTSKLLKWQNAHWIQKEYNQLTQNKFDKMMEEETMNSKYDVDMLVYVDMLRYSIDCINKL